MNKNEEIYVHINYCSVANIKFYLLIYIRFTTYKNLMFKLLKYYMFYYVEK